MVRASAGRATCKGQQQQDQPAERGKRLHEFSRMKYVWGWQRFDIESIQITGLVEEELMNSRLPLSAIWPRTIRISSAAALLLILTLASWSQKPQTNPLAPKTKPPAPVEQPVKPGTHEMTSADR